MKTLRIAVPLVLATAMAVLLLLGRYRLDYDMLILGFPLALGGFAIVMAAIAIVVEWRAPAGGPEKKGMFDEAEELLDKPQAWAQFAWLAGGIALCLGLGFAIGPALLVAAYLRAYRQSWLFSAMAGVLTGGTVWLIFGWALQTPLPMLPLFLR
jgi:hypothetical protein